MRDECEECEDEEGVKQAIYFIGNEGCPDKEFIIFFNTHSSFSTLSALEIGFKVNPEPW